MVTEIIASDVSSVAAFALSRQTLARPAQRIKSTTSLSQLMIAKRIDVSRDNRESAQLRSGLPI